MVENSIKGAMEGREERIGIWERGAVNLKGNNIKGRPRETRRTKGSHKR